MKRAVITSRRAEADPHHRVRPVDPPPVAQPPEFGFAIARMSPFSIGFFGALGAMVAITLIGILGQIQSILVLVVLSLFIALGLSPAVEILNRRGLRRGLSVGVVALTSLAVIVLAAWAVVPVFTEQVTQLVTSAPDLLVQLRENRQIAELDRHYGVIQRSAEFFTSQGLINTIFGGLLGAGKVLANVVFSLIVTMVLTLYFLATLPAIKETIYRLAPASRRPRVRYLADEMFRRIGGYLSGMFLVVTTSGTCSFIFMMVIGLAKYALALAVMVALFAFIPLVGSNLSMVLVSLVAFTTIGPLAAIATIAYFLIYQQFEAYVIQPRVMKRQVDVPGALVIVAALAGGTLLGIVGALMAIPTAAALLLLYREVLLPRLDRT
ncbi:MAG: AI-2E family transporter [Propionibacteriaceae bacterium]|nr:AI-2E family transporter [Propionibacteriaceae bacterium]